MSDADRDDDRYSSGAFDPVMVDEMDTYDATDEDDEPAGRGWLMLIVVLAVLAALAGVVYFAYQQGREEGIRTAPPIVRADGGPEKVAPQDPGGIDIPHQDKEIFERITGDTSASNADSGVERLLPPPEEPAQLPAATPAQQPAATPRSPSTTETLLAPSGTPAPATTPPPAPSAPAAPAAAQPAPTPAPAPSPAPRPTPAAAPAATGAWVVQIGAFRDTTRANTEWAGVQRKHPSILGSASADIQRADLGDRGIWYRLRASGFASKDAANSACAALKAAGTDCLVRKR